MTTVICSECAAEISLDDKAEVGEIIVCPECGVDLEITSLDPAEVELAPDGRRRLGRVIFYW